MSGKSRTSLGALLGIAIGSVSTLLGNYAIAQISSDSTQPVNSSITKEGNIFNITGGTQAGSNLFHSFSEFSVPTGSSAIFSNTSNIQNIISRVTGNSISNIDGLIKANSTANLLLLNPNGIIFGSNAKLDIGGSFVTSTANSFRFSDGKEFSATNPQAPPLLTVNVIPGLKYGLTRPKSQISNAGKLVVDVDKSLILHSGTITSTGSLRAPGGTISLEAEGNISTKDILTDNIQGNGGAIGLISHNGEINTIGGVLNSRSLINSRNSGAISLEAKGNIITGDILTDNIQGNGGAISLISHHGKINTTGGEILSKAGQQGGTIFLSAQDDISIFFLESSADQIRGGDIDIISHAANVYIIKPKGGIVNQTFDTAKGGNINITAGSSLFIQAGVQVSTSTKGSGRGGNLTVYANESVEISGTSSNSKDPSNSSGLSVNVVNSPYSKIIASGDGGNLTIETGRLIVRDGGQISTSAFSDSTGNAGNLKIIASEVEVSGVAPSGFTGEFPISVLSAVTQGAGNGGNIIINTKRLIVKDGGAVASASAGTGNAGNIKITGFDTPSDLIEITGGSADGKFVSGIAVDTVSYGKVGNLTLKTGKLILRNGAAISASTFGINPGGNLNIEATNSVQVSGTYINGFASGVYAQTFANGQAGNVEITTGELTASDHSIISVASGSTGVTRVPLGILNFLNDHTLNNTSQSYINSDTSKGNAGDVHITANSIRLDEASILGITASGNGGDITLNLKDLLLLQSKSQISTSAGTDLAGGNGGNITINIPNGFIVAVLNEDSDITANAYTGQGGRINITTSGIFGIDPRQSPTPLSDITASSQLGIDGTVEIITPEVNPSQGLVELPVNLVDASQQIDTSCNVGGKRRRSSFVVTGRGGLPLQPGEPLRTEALILNEAGEENRSASVNFTPESTIPLVEAQGWIVNSLGEVILTAYPTSVTPSESFQSTPITCHAS